MLCLYNETVRVDGGKPVSWCDQNYHIAKRNIVESKYWFELRINAWRATPTVTIDWLLVRAGQCSPLVVPPGVHQPTFNAINTIMFQLIIGDNLPSQNTNIITWQRGLRRIRGWSLAWPTRTVCQCDTCDCLSLCLSVTRASFDVYSSAFPY